MFCCTPSTLRLACCLLLRAAVLYEYAVEAGTMDRASYFGWSTDLYQ